MLGHSPCEHGAYSKDNLLESPLSWDEQQLQTHLGAMARAITEQYGERAPLLVGIESGGAWVARALNAMLAKPHIGHRQLPIRADICGETLALPPHQRVELRGPSPLVAEIRNLVVEDETETRS